TVQDGDYGSSGTSMS
nr:immunoglobulin heavy chain junction region [Mus musculus]